MMVNAEIKQILRQRKAQFERAKAIAAKRDPYLEKTRISTYDSKNFKVII